MRQLTFEVITDIEDKEGKKGNWVTIRGTHVFIPEGASKAETIKAFIAKKQEGKSESEKEESRKKFYEGVEKEAHQKKGKKKKEKTEGKEKKEKKPKPVKVEVKEKEKSKPKPKLEGQIKAKEERIQKNLTTLKAINKEFNSKLIEDIIKLIFRYLKHPDQDVSQSLHFYIRKVRNNKAWNEEQKNKILRRIKELEKLTGKSKKIDFNIITKDYPVQEHTRESGKVQVKAHTRGEGKGGVFEGLEKVCTVCKQNESNIEIWFKGEFIDTVCASCVPDILKKTIKNIEDIDKINLYQQDFQDFTYDTITLTEFKNITNDFPKDKVKDFTVLEGPITRAGPFPYELGGEKVTLYKQWDNLKDIFSKLDYLPLIGSKELGAHESETLGFAYNFRFDNEKERVFADIVTLEDMNLLTDNFTPENEGWEVSIGFKDYRMGNKQMIDKADHVAVSLLNKEVGRCRAGGDPCYINVKNHDQNLEKEVIS